MNKEKLRIICSCIICIVLFLGGCNRVDGGKEPAESIPLELEEEQTTVSEEITEDVEMKEEVFLWLAYWNHDGYEAELKCLGEVDKAVSVFGVLFDIDGDKPLVLPQTEELLQKVKSDKQEDKIIYLSFINDIRLKDQNYSNKDVDLLSRLLCDSKTRTRHVNEIVEIAMACDVDGIEIDYENIKKKEELWEPFCIFLKELLTRCEEEGLLLRVVLGAYDVDKADFPEGIEYSVMCYNLYGTHSGPGPKADFSFLKQTFEKCKELPGSVSAAFSTGGFEWVGEKCERALTETEAAELYNSLNGQVSELIRDKESGVLSFCYEKDGEIHEVWYADAETLRGWKKVAEEYGITKFSLWKAGGNAADSLEGFAG